jgi:hypothetical protein
MCDKIRRVNTRKKVPVRRRECKAENSVLYNIESESLEFKVKREDTPVGRKDTPRAPPRLPDENPIMRHDNLRCS